MIYQPKEKEKIEFTTILENAEEATLYQHFKGDYYKILTMAKDCKNLEEVIIYQGQYEENPFWVRRIDDFFSEVDHIKYPDVKQQYRFQKVEKKI